MNHKQLEQVFKHARDKNVAQSSDAMRLVNDLKQRINAMSGFKAEEFIEQNGPAFFVTKEGAEKTIMINCYRTESDIGDCEHQWPEYNAFQYSVIVENHSDNSWTQETIENISTDNQTLEWIIKQTVHAFQ